jgi:hypothetical protein
MQTASTQKTTLAVSIITIIATAGRQKLEEKVLREIVIKNMGERRKYCNNFREINAQSDKQERVSHFLKSPFRLICNCQTAEKCQLL